MSSLDKAECYTAAVTSERAGYLAYKINKSKVNNDTKTDCSKHRKITMSSEEKHTLSKYKHKSVNKR